ncbi:hypothetical protein ES703_57696 [subsurface metagenome]
MRKFKKRREKKHCVNYELEPNGKYRIDNYDEAPAFSSFLPGIGGPDGIPLWCMYVNRAQAVVSFGVANKDNAIAEFLPATWAYQLVGIQGFRTFCKVDGHYYEPFRNDLENKLYDYTRVMWIEPDRIELQEVNETFGLSFKVSYYSLTNQPLAALVRSVTISNIGKNPRSLNILDGLPVIIPKGLTDAGLKTMRRISEAFASARLCFEKVPVYAAKVLAHDEAEVKEVKGGNFYASWFLDGNNLKLIEPFVDPDLVFGNGNDLVTPHNFIDHDQLLRTKQVLENRLPCALTPLETSIGEGETVVLITVTGFSPKDQMLGEFLSSFNKLEHFEDTAKQSRKIIDEVTTPAFTVSNVPVLDAYARQNYLDNVLRGGIPKLLPSKSGPTLLHLYSRRHGDLERDYNYFELAPYPLSTGHGHYRDICQNNRCNIWFYPYLLDQEIRMFVALLRADGYNPLAVIGYRWFLSPGEDYLRFCPADDENARVQFRAILERRFHPGEILAWANLHEITIEDRSKWLKEILSHCDRELVAQGHEGGYWIDHWTYITDLLDMFAQIFPDRVVQMLTESADITWFDDGAYVVPRSDKYVLRPGGPLQLNAVVDTPASSKSLPPVTVFGKLCALMAVKVVSFDYEGKGIEMEAGRPGWNDSLNGLPGLFGSSTCETAELGRMAAWLREHLPEIPDATFPLEVADFIDEVAENLQDRYNWDRAAAIREKYRLRIHKGASGKTRTISGQKLGQLLTGIESRAQEGIEKSIDPDTGLLHTYYQSEPIRAETQKNSDESNCLDPKTGSLHLKIDKFIQKPLPLFLEGQVHWIRLLKNPDAVRQIYHTVRNGPLFDTSLKMYKLNECLESCPPEIGRARTFTRGWYENESIWLHMSYKYLLELLRCGLAKELFEDAKTMMVPFMDPAVYGRSVLENSSFIASSVCPDSGARGRGFVARLSGSTVEFIHIWLLLTVGQQPFYLKEDKLHFRLSPSLPGQWFTKDRKVVTWRGQQVDIPANCFACALLGQILLVYHNASRADTFGQSAVKPVRYLLDDKRKIEAQCLDSEIAEAIRQRKYDRIDVWLE